VIESGEGVGFPAAERRLEVTDRHPSFPTHEPGEHPLEEGL